MYAECSNEDGDFVESRLDLNKCIANDNGALSGRERYVLAPGGPLLLFHPLEMKRRTGLHDLWWYLTDPISSTGATSTTPAGRVSRILSYPLPVKMSAPEDWSQVFHRRPPS